MASGSVIHEVHHAHDHIHHGNGDGHGHDFDPQDMRNMGGLASKMPVTATAMMFGSMSIIGIPLIGGFWSKEGIIAETWLANSGARATDVRSSNTGFADCGHDRFLHVENVVHDICWRT